MGPHLPGGPSACPIPLPCGPRAAADTLSACGGRQEGPSGLRGPRPPSVGCSGLSQEGGSCRGAWEGQGYAGSWGPTLGPGTLMLCNPRCLQLQPQRGRAWRWARGRAGGFAPQGGSEPELGPSQTRGERVGIPPSPLPPCPGLLWIMLSAFLGPDKLSPHVRASSRGPAGGLGRFREAGRGGSRQRRGEGARNTFQLLPCAELSADGKSSGRFMGYEVMCVNAM